MSERHLHPTLPGMSKIELLESMSAEQLVDHAIALGARATQIQVEITLAADVFEGTYGVPLADAITERENTNGDPAA